MARGRLELSARSADDTRDVGAALAELLRTRDIVSLTGDLGAGKTTFVQGIARGFGITEPVLSPTFTLVREYEATPRVYHLDVYRLERLQDVIDLGLDEMLDRDGVVFIEWGDAIDALLPEDHLQVELTIDPDGATRHVVLTASGPSWAQRWERLEQVLSPWSEA